MNDEMIDLARRAVACKGWRWMPGMLAALDVRGRLRVSSTLPGELVGLRMGGRVVWSDDGVFPDFRDPATLGCLLALVREVLGEPLASVEVRQPGDLGCRACVRVPVGSEGWRVVQWWRASQDPQYTEAAALVAALEAAMEAA